MRTLVLSFTCLWLGCQPGTAQPEPLLDQGGLRERAGAWHDGGPPAHDLRGESRTPVSARAFPTAEGFGARAVGGRGGAILEVTTLEDTGPGSLRAAIEASGPRIVVFRVGGTIELRTPLRIRNPRITIAGQTAPGRIALRNAPSNAGKTLEIEADQVVIRHLRLRPGPSAEKTAMLDALSIVGGRQIMIDHLSASWAVDEVVEVWGPASEISLQWSILSEALNKSVHPKGPHSMGALLGDQATRISIHHCLFAHNQRRNPRIAGGRVEVVNNVIYDYGEHATLVRDDSSRVEVNLVGNLYQPGPSSNPTLYPIQIWSPGNYGLHAYLAGNTRTDRPAGSSLDWKVLSGLAYLVSARFAAPPITETSAALAYERVLADAGATLPERDAVDRRLVEEVRNGTGGMIDHPSQVGGWPALVGGAAPPDADHDGMPDAWEKLHGLDPASPGDGTADADQDGYSNVEEYLNDTSPRAVDP